MTLIEFECRSTEEGAYWETVKAYDAGMAAETFAESSDQSNAEFCVEREVKVAGHGVFVVTGEMQAIYSAAAKKEASNAK